MALIISLPSSIEGRDFEDTLNLFLPKSRSRNEKSITFDMSKVEWCELYELSLLTVWIWGLVQAHKSVTLIYPQCEPLFSETDREAQARAEKRKKVCSYLNRWEFDKYLRSQGVSIEGHDQDYPYWPTQPEQESILPLRFFQDTNDFHSFLANLSDSKQLDLLFQDSVLLSVIGSGGMRDVILKEIGQNIYDHANGNCAFCTIVAIPSIQQGSSWAHRKLRNPLEGDFFRTLGRSGYLQVVIADHGPGIYSTLLDAYKKDERLPQSRRTNVDPVDVLAYAFEFDSTRKERKEFVSLPNEEEDPGRGLYWVREIALQNRGLLSVRSGPSLLRFDFLNSGDRHSFKAYEEGGKVAQVSPLGGTQFKLLFPLNPDLISSRVELRGSSSVSSRKDIKAQPTYFVVELPHQVMSDPARRLEELKAVLENVPRPLGRTGSSFVVIFDFSHTAWHKDVLVPFLMRLSAMQHEGLTAILANTAHLSQLLSIASPILADKIKANPLKFRALAVWNSAGLSVIGLLDQDRSYLEPLWAEGDCLDLPIDSSEYWRHRYGHLLELSPEGMFIPRLAAPNVAKSLASHYASKVKTLTVDEKIGIYHEGKFLLPTNVYVDGYFQLGALLKGDQQRRLLRFIFVSRIRSQSSGAEGIITISPELEILGKEIAEDLQTILGRRMLDVNLGDLRGKDAPRNLLAPLRGKKVVILTGVLGTGRTLEVTLDACRFLSSPISVVQIVCIVDARDKSSVLRRGSEIVEDRLSYEGSTYSLNSILVHPLRFYDSRPASWRREEIVRIDPVTNAPTPTRLESASSPLWQPVDRFFLENIVLNSGSLLVGHYVRLARHYIYFFDMVTLANSVGPEIAGKIKSDVVSYCSNSQSGEAAVSHVIFDESNRGAQAVAHQVSKAFEHVEPLSAQRLASASRIEREALIGRDVIIFLSSVVRGNHLQHLLDAVASCRPRRMFAYAIMHRKESDSVPFYQRIDNYHGIETRVRYFVELEIPSFTIWDCPACNMRNQLTELYATYEDEQLRKVLLPRLLDIEPRPIASDDKFSTLEGDEVLELVRQTVLRRRLGAAKTELQARYPIADMLEGHAKNWDEALRLLQVLAREIILFATYEELLYPEFKKWLNQTCLDALVRRADPDKREESALIILRHISPDFLVSNLLSIFRGVSFKDDLVYSLFRELFAMVFKNQVELSGVLEAVNLCQSSLENDEIFAQLPVARVLNLQHMLNFIGRRIRIKQVRAELGDTSPQLVLTKLWNAFVRQPGRVHPEFVQVFTQVISIHSLASFRDTYTSAYGGPYGLGSMFEQVVPLFDSLERLLRPEIRNNLIYFFSRGEGTFSGDLEVIDDSLRTMATLDRQSRLTDEQVDQLFFDNARVNASIGRLRRHVFEDNSLLRQALRGKFSSVSQIMQAVLRQWEHRFYDKKIAVEFREQEADAFIPAPVLEDVVGSFLSNIYKHAFQGRGLPALVRVEIAREVGNVLIIIEDSGRGISEGDIEKRPDGGIRRSNSLLARYGGSAEPKNRVSGNGEVTQGTTVVITLLSKEEVLSWGRD